jgi:hypothetical protein
MAQRPRDFDELLRRSICAAAASITVGDDGLERIRAQLAQAQSLAAADDREIAAREARSARGRQPCAGRRRGGRHPTQKPQFARGPDSQIGS